MSRPASAELLAAATSRRGVPVVLLDVQDRQTRWVQHACGPASTRRCDVVGVGGVVHRVLLQGSNVLYAAITAPQEPAAWPGVWHTVASDADGDADVALASSGGALSIFFRNAAGWLARVDSADRGLTWSAPAGCCAWDYATRIAAAGVVCVWSRPSEVRVAITRDDLGQPAWLAAGTYGGAGAFAQCDGLALCGHHSDPHLYYLVSALDGALRVASYHEPSRSFGATHRILPPGSGGPASTSQVRQPSATATEDGLYVSCVDRVGEGDLAHWQQPLVLRAVEYPHFGRIAILDMGQAEATRAALAGDGQYVYAAYENAVCRAALPGGAAAALDNADLQPTAYTLRSDGQGSRLSVWLPNVGGAYDMLGDPSGGCGAIRPWSRLLLRRGYRTAAGAETVALPLHYVDIAHLEHGPEGSVLRLVAVDGRGLLSRWHSPDVGTWEGEPIRTLLGQVAGQVGLACADAGEPELGATLARFTLTAGERASRAVRDLLALAGAVSYCDERGVLQARVLTRHAPEPLAVGAAAEILQWSRALHAERAPAVRVYGEDATAASDPTATTMQSAVLLYESVVDHRATTADLAARLAAHTAELSRLASGGDVVLVPLRPDVELWDRVTLPATFGALGLGPRRIVGVQERYDAARGVFASRLTVAPGEG